MNNYTEQAENFLQSANTTLTVKFNKYGKHFATDTESRDIYKCILKNSCHKYSFNFGQSINGTNSGEIPTAYDILACIEKYPVYDFTEFCADYGYDLDSRTAYKIYKSVKREWENINKLFTEEQLEQLREIQ